MTRIGFLLLTLLTASTIGCEDSSYTPIGGDERFDQLADEDAPVLASSYGTVVDSVLSVCKEGGQPCASDQTVNAIARVRGIMAVNQDGAAVHGSLTACSIKVLWDGENYDIAEYLDLAKLGEIYAFDGGFADGESGPVLHSDFSSLLLGASLEEPVSEDFPTSEDDARVFDQDGDGKPGVSADAPVGKIYLGARAIVDFAASVEEDGSVRGELNGHEFNVSIFDDTVPFVNVRKKVDKALSPLSLNSQSHTVVMHPDVVDCAGLAEAEAAALLQGIDEAIGQQRLWQEKASSPYYVFLSAQRLGRSSQSIHDRFEECCLDRHGSVHSLCKVVPTCVTWF